MKFNKTIKYKFDDNTVSANTVYYYRLKQIDFDGDIEYSNIVSAIFKDGKGFTLVDLYPNPATNKVVISVAIDITKDAKTFIRYVRATGSCQRCETCLRFK